MEFINQNILLISIVVVSGLGLLAPQVEALRALGEGRAPAAVAQAEARERAPVAFVFPARGRP